MRRFKKLKYKFSIPVILLASLVLIISGAFEYVMAEKSLKSASKEKADTKLKIFEMAIINPVWNYNKDDLKASSEAILADKEVTRVVVLDSKGNEMFKGEKTGSASNDKYLIKRKKDLIKDGNKLGHIQLSVTQYYETQKAKKQLIGKAVQTIVIIAVLWFVILSLSNKIVREINKLVEFTEKVAGGDFSARLETRLKDEIGQLSQKCNEMAENLYKVNNESQYHSMRLTELQKMMFKEKKP